MVAGGWLRRVPVVAAPAGGSRGMLRIGSTLIPCALGRTGVTRRKREGDGATPAGVLDPVLVYWRPDRLRRPLTALPVEPIRPNSGWCDDPADRNYNRPVTLPFAPSHERLWREDGLYDICVVLDWNLARPAPGAGSAIFLHLAAEGFAATAGCIAVTLPAMLRLLRRATTETGLETR